MGEAAIKAGPRAFDLLRAPVAGWILRRPIGRRVLQSLVLLVALVMILDGFFGPQLAPKNLATVLGWVHYRGLLILVLLAAGNFFCMTCPFTLARDVARKLFRPTWNWPRRLRRKWLAIGLFVAILFAYELFDLWGNPAWTASLIVAYFVGAIVVDSLFKSASFCKYVCPIGQFNFVSSTLSPLEVRVRDMDVCTTCRTVDCIRGRRDPGDPELVIQRGCELALFQPKKVGNLDCTFCLDCVHACPHDNVGILSRVPAGELATDDRRSGIGRLTKRHDISVLALIFTFGALLNAFAMVSPVYVVQQWIADALGTVHEWPVLATLFAAALVAEPVLLTGAAAMATRTQIREKASVWSIVSRFSFGLVPIGVAIWAAHYSFHLLTGIWTWIPAASRALSDVTGLGSGSILMMPGLPQDVVFPIELGLIGLGALGSILVCRQIAVQTYPGAATRASVPWIVLSLAIAGAAVWLLSQPMEMRGTFLGA